MIATDNLGQYSAAELSTSDTTEGEKLLLGS